MSKNNKSTPWLKRRVRALETNIKTKRSRLAHVAAKFVEKINAGEASTLTRRQLSQVERGFTVATSVMREYLAALRDRLDNAKASAFLRPVFRMPIMLRTAYFRDRVISLLLSYSEAHARRANNQGCVALLTELAEKWDACDKGNLRGSQPAVEALHLLRKAYIAPHLADAAQLGKTQRHALDGQLFTSLHQACEENNMAEFSRALERANRFRAKRLKLCSRIGGVTEEADANHKTDIMAWTIVKHLFNLFPPDDECWKDLLREYGYSGDGRNFQALLHWCLHPFKKAGEWRGAARMCT
jgi:hypothetical protein